MTETADIVLEHLRAIRRDMTNMAANPRGLKGEIATMRSLLSDHPEKVLPTLR